MKERSVRRNCALGVALSQEQLFGVAGMALSKDYMGPVKWVLAEMEASNCSI